MIDYEKRKIVASLQCEEQIGQGCWRTYFATEDFVCDVPFYRILEWAQSINKNATLNHLYFKMELMP